MWPNDLRLTRLLKYGVAFLSFAVVAVTLFVWSGIYNVAASEDHWRIVTWILEQVRVRSVETRSFFVEKAPPLDDSELVKLGAAHFEGGCTPCHSQPGESRNAIVLSMLPPPPPLGRAVADNDAKELFWVVKHGLKFSAMPAWPSQERDDEVWAMTSFLVRLPDLSQEAFHELSGSTRVSNERRSNRELAESSKSVALTQCIRCHGDASTPPLSQLVPLLNGQSSAYLERALSEYAAGNRASGIMQPVAGLLEPDERRRLATWFSRLDTPSQQTPVAREDVERGRELAIAGDTDSGIPPCLSCHSEHHRNTFPSLAGQNSRYLQTQLGLFKSGSRDDTVYARIMTVVAERLTKSQVRDAAAYFASLPPHASDHAKGHDR